MAKPDRDIYIVNIGGEFRVRPAVAPVKGGQSEKVVFRNATDADATVIFPSGVSTSGDSQTLKAGRDGKFDLVSMNATDAPKVVAYAVAVFKNGEWILAKGESGPTIIIDP